MLWVANCSNLALIGCSLLLKLLINILFNLFAATIGGYSISHGAEKMRQVKWFEFVIGGPLLEAILYQVLIIYFAKKLFPWWVACLLSAVLFGLSHRYNIFYEMATFIAGLWYAVIYYAKTYLAPSRFRGFLICVIIHILNNSIAFLLNRF
jgi:membrane protease YdiL (CAAX protease family)